MKSLYLLFFLPLLLCANKAIAISSESDVAFMQKLIEKTPMTIASCDTSENNLIALQSKKVDFAIINSDSAYNITEKMPNLRSIVALYPKMLTFISKKEAGIHSLEDIKNKKLPIAFTTSAASIRQQVLKEFDIHYSSKLCSFEKAKEALKKGRIEGFFALVGHPSREIEELRHEQNITIVPLFGKKFDQLKNDYSYIIKGGIPKGMYDTQEDIKSIGVKALLVTRKDMNATVVYNITKSILENMPDIKKSDYIYRGISKKTLLEGHSITEHKAAIKAFNDF